VNATTAVAAFGFLAGAAASALVASSDHDDVGSEPQNNKKRKLLLGVDDDAKRTQSDEDGDNVDDTSDCIYLDYNGTTPVYPDVLQEMLPYLTRHYGNASSGHCLSRAPKRALEEARRRVLTHMLGVDESDEGEFDLSSIVFTSCGTESDNLAIHLAMLHSPNAVPVEELLAGSSSSKKKKKEIQLPHIVTSNIEHPAVEACLRTLEERGLLDVTYVPVGKDGRVSAEDVVEAIDDERTVLVTLMLANNETGAIQPVAEVAEHCNDVGVLFHTDASQAAGKIPLNLKDLGEPDFVTLAGHKMGAPKGVACLYVKPDTYNEKVSNSNGVQIVGGSQEFGVRAGTENVASIVGMGYAAAKAAAALPESAERMRKLRDRLYRNLQRGLGPANVRKNGPDDPELTLPNTLSVGIAGVRSGAVLAAVGDRVAASAGATCHSSPDCGISGVLKAMKVPKEFAVGTLRLSLGPSTTQADVDKASQILIAEVKKQQKEKKKIRKR